MSIEDIGSVAVTLILQMRQLWHRDMKEAAQSCRGSKWYNYHMKPKGPAAEPRLLPSLSRLGRIEDRGRIRSP